MTFGVLEHSGLCEGCSSEEGEEGEEAHASIGWGEVCKFGDEEVKVVVVVDGNHPEAEMYAAFMCVREPVDGRMENAVTSKVSAASTRERTDWNGHGEYITVK